MRVAYIFVYTLLVSNFRGKGVLENEKWII